jgi:predicted GH43/DUF377 family glycosyl hydrolase
MLHWRKLGMLFRPAGRLPWMHEFAQVPTTLLLPDRLRVYFSCRPQREADGSCLSYSGFVDLDRSDPQTVLEVSPEPVLELGEAGCFDQFGVMAGSVVAVGDEFWLYYCGWSRRVAVPYDWAIGLAVSRDGGRSFVRRGQGPIVGPSLDEPYLQACPIVRRLADDDWHMWYLSGTRWLQPAAQPESVYVIMHATSRDGLNWLRNAQAVIPTRVADECQTSAATFAWQGHHRMLFSYRHGLDFRNPDRGYRIGHAVSDDLRHWQRDDREAGIAPSAAGWDSQMICYPHVFELHGRTLLLYCGNEFGREGFGWAELIA